MGNQLGLFAEAVRYSTLGPFGRVAISRLVTVHFHKSDFLIHIKKIIMPFPVTFAARVISRAYSI